MCRKCVVGRNRLLNTHNPETQEWCLSGRHLDAPRSKPKARTLVVYKLKLFALPSPRDLRPSHAAKWKIHSFVWLSERPPTTGLSHPCVTDLRFPKSTLAPRYLLRKHRRVVRGQPNLAYSVLALPQMTDEADISAFMSSAIHLSETLAIAMTRIKDTAGPLVIMIP